MNTPPVATKRNRLKELRLLRNSLQDLGGRRGLACAILAIMHSLVPAKAQDSLFWEVGTGGFVLFEQNGYSYLTHPSDGMFSVFARTPIFEGEGDEGLEENSWAEIADSGEGVSLIYPWGKVDGIVTQADGGLDLRVNVENSSTRTIERVAIQFVRLTFSQPAEISVNGESSQVFDGGVWPVLSFDAAVNPIVATSPEGVISLGATADPAVEGTFGFFFAESEGLTNRIGVSLEYIPAGESRTVTLHIRTQ